MPEENQEPWRKRGPQDTAAQTGGAVGPGAEGSFPETHPAGGPPTAERLAWPAPLDSLPTGPSVARGLTIWLVVLLASGVLGLLFGMQEMAALVAVAGLFVAAQAADIDPRWKHLYYAISWVVPTGGAIGSLAIGVAIGQSDMAPAPRMVITAVTVGAAGVCLMTVFRPFSDSVAGLLFRLQAPSHTLRLTTRIVLITLLLAVPGWFAVRSFFDELFADPTPLLERVSLGGELVGYVLLALASVGFLVRRGVRTTLERLGIRPLTRVHVATVILGVVGLYGLNTGADQLQRQFFHDLWVGDQRINQMIVQGLGPGRVLMLGLTAGIGEEVTMRGALQPKLGLILTSILFASLHVQYSWFGMGVIFLLGLILGVIRKQSSTTVAIAVHTIYDVLAVLSV